MKNLHVDPTSEDRARLERERIFFAIVAVLGRPRSFLDVGCGDGWLVRCARQLGARPALGVGTEADKQAGRKWAPIVVYDVQRAFRLNCVQTCKFQMVLSCGPALLENLQSHTERDGYLITSQLYQSEALGLEFDRANTARLASALGSSLYEVYTCRS